MNSNHTSNSITHYSPIQLDRMQRASHLLEFQVGVKRLHTKRGSCRPSIAAGGGACIGV